MIGISTGSLDDLHRLVKIDSPLHKQPDQLRNHHRRMSIINLNHRIIRQVMKITSLSHTLIQNQLCSIADHKILLIDPQLPSRLVTVVRIQKQRQVLPDLLLVKGNAFLHNSLIHTFHIKQMQPVCPVLIPCHRNIIQTRMHGQLPESNRVGYLPTNQPALILNPRIRHLLLKTILKLLLKQSHMVIQPDSGAV